MPSFEPKPRFWHRLIQNIAATRFGSWLLADNLHKIDRPVLRLTKGRTSLTSLLSGLPVVVLSTIGVKSGRVHTTPLSAIKDGSRIVLIASALGKPRHPAWYHNLKANADAKIQINGTTYPCKAYQVDGEERRRYWEQAVRMYAGFARYAEQAHPRRIPVIVLEVEGLA